MSRSVRKELRLTAEMVERIDDARGDVSFNRFVERALERMLVDDRLLDAPAKNRADVLRTPTDSLRASAPAVAAWHPIRGS